MVPVWSCQQIQELLPLSLSCRNDEGGSGQRNPAPQVQLQSCLDAQEVAK